MVKMNITNLIDEFMAELDARKIKNNNGKKMQKEENKKIMFLIKIKKKITN